jgi:HTH-type transcriptional regulator/antitoxin HipB
MQQFLSNPVQLGQILQSARKARKLTQAAVAQHLGLSQSRLSVLETDPSAITFQQLMALVNLYDLRLQLLDKQTTAPTKASW